MLSKKYFFICIEVFQRYEGKDYDKIYEVLSTLMNKKIKINIILIEKHENMLEYPDFEQTFGQKQLKVFIKLVMIVLD